jgi:hypothetical protein
MGLSTINISIQLHLKKGCILLRSELLVSLLHKKFYCSKKEWLLKSCQLAETGMPEKSRLQQA